MFSRGDLLVDGAPVVAAVEDREIERLGRLGAPQAQRVGGVDAVAEDRRVVGHAIDHARRHPAHADAALLVGVALGVAAELHVDGPLRPHHLPGIAEAQPLVGLLDLPAVDDLLLEDAELVADAVADAGICSVASESMKQAASRPSPPLPRPGSSSCAQQLVEIEPELSDRLACGVVDAEIDQVVGRDAAPSGTRPTGRQRCASPAAV